jgi:flagellar hook-associated protein 3 FlgL
MRIATSSVYQDQSAIIDNLTALYQQQGLELSTGKSLNVPSDDPTQIAEDLAVRNETAVQTTIGQNLSDLNNQLTTADGALASLTSIMQSARSLAIEGASDTLTSSQQQQIGQQVNQLLQEAIGLANTQYNGKYIFSGTSVPSSQPLVQANGSPISSVTSQANTVAQTQELPNGQQVSVGVTLQQAFNVNAPNGSPSLFQVLINLRDTLQNGTVADQSAQQVNLAGTAIDPATTTLAQLSTGAVPQIMATPLQPDSSGNYTINIANGANTSGVNVTLTPGETLNAAIAAINAAAGPIGVSASFDTQTQRLTLSSTSNPNQPFEVTDAPSAGATNSSNVVEAFGLSQQADVVDNLSTQLGDIDNVLTQALNARSTVGSTVQAVQNLSSNASSQVLNDTQIQSNLEDTDIAKVTTEFSETQTVLQAAFATTTRLESLSLFNYLSPTSGG